MKKMMFATAAIAVFVGSVSTANAQQPAGIYHGLVCDKQEQMEQYYSISKDPAVISDEAVAMVNEKSPLACMELDVMYGPRERVSEARVKGGTVIIYRALIVRLLHKSWWVPVMPMILHISGFKQDETL
jgi:hypothetical protein